MEYIKYIPIEMNEIEEYKEIGEAVNPTFEGVKDDMTSISNNHYLSKLDLNGVERMEKIMDISGMEDKTLEARRLYIITKANNTLPYTIYNLKTKIKSLLENDGFTVYMDYDNYHLTITLFLNNLEKVKYVRDQIEAMVPCNIILEFIILYNQYGTFKKFTYGELKSMTHKEMHEKYLPME